MRTGRRRDISPCLEPSSHPNEDHADEDAKNVTAPHLLMRPSNWIATTRRMHSWKFSTSSGRASVRKVSVSGYALARNRVSAS
jgi:hypothetical protein